MIGYIIFKIGEVNLWKKVINYLGFLKFLINKIFILIKICFGYLFKIDNMK